jgi:hypothetical protein
MTRAWSGRQEEASSEEIEAGPAEHLALEHLQAIDLAFDLSLVLGQCHRRLDGGHIRSEPFGKAPEGREGTLGGTSQPWFELGRLALADEAREVPCEGHRLRELGRLLAELRELVTILRRQPLQRTEDQPSGPTRGEQAPWRLRHCRQRLIATALPGCQSLRLAHASDVQRDNAILALKALAADRPEEMPAIPTPAIPASQEHGFVRIGNAAVAAMPRLALRKRRALEIALHGAPTEAHLLRDGVQRSPLLMIRPDLVIMGPPSGTPLAGQSCRCGG